MRKILFGLLVCMLSLAANAQMKLRGEVVDSVTGKPLAKVSVMLLRGGKTLTFARTDANGRFALSVAEVQKGDVVQTTLLGYGRKRRMVTGDAPMRIVMAQEEFRLKEVVVQSSPVGNRKDTTIYDLTRFVNARDNNLKDVLKRLPGVDIAKSGEISFNGKAISRFTVEGLDLSNGRYNQLTENIRAKDVKKAEVVEHDQPIKALRNRTFTDNVAMNVVLKDSARDQLALTLRPYILVGSPTHVGGSATALQIGKKKQRMYGAGYDRTGRDISEEDNRLVFDVNRLQSSFMPSWYSVPSLEAPIDEERLRKNTSQRYNISHTSKTKKDSENLLTASYNRSRIRQETANVSSYFFEGEDPVVTDEKKHLMLTTDDIQLDFRHKINLDKRYGSVDIAFDAKRTEGVEHIENSNIGETNQLTKTPQMHVVANAYQIYTLDKSQMSWKALVEYHHSQNEMWIDDRQQRLTNNLWHGAVEGSYNRKQGYFNRTLTLGVDGENLNVEKDNTILKTYLNGSLNYRRGDLVLTATGKLQMHRYMRQNKTFLTFDPVLFMRYKQNSRIEWVGFANYSERPGDYHYFAIDEYTTDYRTHYVAADFVPLRRSLYGSLQWLYKRPIREFFANMRLTATRYWSNAVSDMTIDNGNYYYRYLKHDTRNDDISLRGNISKGFYKAHLTTSLAVRASYLNGEQYSRGTVSDFETASLAFTPKISFSPEVMSVEYEGTFSLYKSWFSGSSLSPLFNHRQRLSASVTAGNVDMSLAGVYYHNEISGSPSVNTLLADAKVTWRIKKVRLTATLSNIFNKTRYQTTTYRSISSFTNLYVLRPRELMLQAQFSL